MASCIKLACRAGPAVAARPGPLRITVVLWIRITVVFRITVSSVMRTPHHGLFRDASNETFHVGRSFARQRTNRPWRSIEDSQKNRGKVVLMFWICSSKRSKSQGGPIYDFGPRPSNRRRSIHQPEFFIKWAGATGARRVRAGAPQVRAESARQMRAGARRVRARLAARASAPSETQLGARRVRAGARRLRVCECTPSEIVRAPRAEWDCERSERARAEWASTNNGPHVWQGTGRGCSRVQVACVRPLVAALCCGAHQTIGGIDRLFRKCSGGNVDTRALSINRSPAANLKRRRALQSTRGCQRRSWQVLVAHSCRLLIGTLLIGMQQHKRPASAPHSTSGLHTAAQAACAPPHKRPAPCRIYGRQHFPVIFFEEHVEGLVSLERDSGGFGPGLFFSKRRVAAAIHSAESWRSS